MVGVFIFICQLYVRTLVHALGFSWVYVFVIVTANHCQPVRVTQGNLDPPGGICSLFPV